MKTIKKSIDINAAPEVVWSAIISVNKYKAWTDVFHEGSQFSGYWIKDQPLKFFSENPDGNIMGMVVKIAEMEFLKFISIKPLGFFNEEEEDYESDDAKLWQQTHENYTFETLPNGICRFSLDQLVPEQYYDHMESQWVLALEKLKEVCEKNLAPFHKITIEAMVETPLEVAWSYWTDPAHMVKWNFASDDWHCPKASMDLRVGGSFTSTMAAKDGSVSFDFGADFIEVVPQKRLVSLMADGRMMWVDFHEVSPTTVHVVESFEAEGENSLDLQREGWQAILNNYKKAAEASQLN